MIFKALATGLLTILTVIAGYIGLKEPPLGAEVPISVAVFETTLSSKLTSSATSTTLVTGTDKSGDALDGYMCFTIDGGKTNEEFVCGTASSTNITSLLRGIDPVDGDEEVAALKKEHRAGANVKITDWPGLGIVSRMLNGDETIPNVITYATDTHVFTGDTDIPNKLYVDTVATSGAANANFSTAGILTLASTSHFINGVGTSTAVKFLVPNTSFFNTTSAAYKAVVADASGKIKQGWLDLAASWTFSGVFNITGTTSPSYLILTASTSLTATPTAKYQVANKAYCDQFWRITTTTDKTSERAVLNNASTTWHQNSTTDATGKITFMNIQAKFVLNGNVHIFTATSVTGTKTEIAFCAPKTAGENCYVTAWIPPNYWYMASTSGGGTNNTIYWFETY